MPRALRSAPVSRFDAKFFFCADDAHSASAAARRRFDNYRKTDFLCQLYRFVRRFNRFGRPGKIGTPAAFIVRRASTLSPIILMTCGSRSDKFDVAVFADFRKSFRFGQKSVARMNRVNIRDFRRADDCRNIQIALRRRRCADANGFVGISARAARLCRLPNARRRC